MNTEWGYLWRVLRSLVLSTAEGDDALEQLRQHGLPYPGWPTTEQHWLTAARAASLDVRGSYQVFLTLLADALHDWSEEVLIMPGSVDYTLTWTGVGVQHQNRLIHIPGYGVYMSGHLDSPDLYLARGHAHWADPVATWDDLVLTGAFVGYVLPFTIHSLSPGADDPIGYTYSGGATFSYKGRPCTVELRLLDGFIELMPPWPWLYEDGEDAYLSGTWGTCLHAEGTDTDGDFRGIYLADSQGTDIMPNLTNVIERGVLASGVHLAVDVGLGTFERAVAPLGD